MTIKPVVAAPAQKRAAAIDAENENHSGQVGVGGNVGAGSNNGVGGGANVSAGLGGVNAEPGSSLGQQNVMRSAAPLAHRNVIESPQRRSPHKSHANASISNNNPRSKRRDHHNDPMHHKRERAEREQHLITPSSSSSMSGSPLAHVSFASGAASSGSASPTSSSMSGGSSPGHLSSIPAVLGAQNSGPKTPTSDAQAATDQLQTSEDAYSGYNSGDEHCQPKEGAVSADEWKRRDEQFAKCMSERGYIVRPVEEDGACLFRCISLQLFGDEGMHDLIRQNTMDYIYKNRDEFGHFVCEDIHNYIERKRRNDSHGNHIEIQAMSEIYGRPVEVYCYEPTPINIFSSKHVFGNPPLRLSYQRGSHYNAILDPYNPTVGVGLGLAGYKPEMQTKEALRLSEQLEIEQTMFEDKLKTTDWEATNEAIEEQIARESYLQWCRETMQRSRGGPTATISSAARAATATITSADISNNNNNNNNSSSSSIMDASPSNDVGNNEPNDPAKKSAPAGDNDDCAGAKETLQSKETEQTEANNAVAPPPAPSCADSLDEEQLPSTSKQSMSPEKLTAAGEAHTANVATNTTTTTTTTTATAAGESLPSTSSYNSEPPQQQPPISNFYQELLESSYAADGFEQLTESEMLQRAIQLSTQDYFEEQKRKYLYRPESRNSNKEHN